ncbi:UDP-2,4-diacetamido-2,4,6-trideoxy-beta-L-altropyranose hydrolase [bacterium]|nr:UDP-2,4-diacetamido-2,4,6-trideoxy-beta-L-altropyranose hydrolase [bacterium]MBU0899641.1 UDP-2,4-diacetamido-2,4,6-trideoxy-beta-L-altropyranose hydrolase [bacterium]MBU1152748.1 UDP-2,4-diacetamido-2,4,6-trideoxy-beta-L-altropyranose hydrolase [bacterium]MBU2599092.1 UDP-2,4-diacetamido-2,4,6-trideoxy-beta-L-altropyranose hydrolase [bacterium]
MIRKKVVFRVDGGHKIGFGHIIRALTIAKRLAKKREILFLIKEDELAIEKVREEGYEVYLLSDKFEIVDHLSCEVFVSDIRDTSVDFMKKAKEISKCLVTFDDLGPGRHLADILVDANIEEKATLAVSKEKSNVSLCLYGANYILLREEFEKRQRKKIKENVERILVTMGGSDSKGTTLKVVSALEEMSLNLEVIVILGKGFFLKERLLDLIKRSSEKYKVLSDEKDIFKYMEGADLAISSAGVTMFELACCGVPMVVIPYDEDQEKNTKQFLNQSLLVNLGSSDYVSQEKIFTAVNNLISNLEPRERMSKELQRFVDGKGLFKIIEAIKNTKRRKL